MPHDEHHPTGRVVLSGRFGVYPDRRLVVVSWQETVPHVEQWIETIEKVFTAPGFEPGFGIISDRRNVTEAPLSAFIAEVIAYLRDAALAGRFVGRFAAVVPPASPFLFAMWSGLEQHAAEVGVHYSVFTKMEDAIQWVTAASDGQTMADGTGRDARPLRP